MLVVQHLIGYGGHFAAAGMTLDPANVEAFSAAFEQVVSNTITPDLLIPEIIIDSEISISELTESFHNIIAQMEPFGPDNMKPVFIAKNVSNTGFSKIVKEQHIRFSVQQKNIQINGIGFNMAHKYDILQNNKFIDIVFNIDLNEWNGNTNVQLKVIDFKASQLAN
jgi:single-stranded-DNA-specific exonuclease